MSAALTPRTPPPWYATDTRRIIDGDGMEIEGEDGGFEEQADRNFAAHAVNCHDALVHVAAQLVEFQRIYHGYTQDHMPGNEHYATWLMRIVTDARAALLTAQRETA